MNARGDTPITREELGQQSAELAALRRMLAASEGTFSFSIAVCNRPSLRDYLVSKLREECPSIAVVEIDKEVTDILDLVSRSITGMNNAGIFIIGIEKLLPSDQKEHKVLQVLNATRESWRSHFSCPVVFWLPEYAATLLSVHAHDLWSWLSHSFEFISEQATASLGTLDTYAGDIMSAGRLDADQKRFRIAELEQRIDDAGAPPKPQLAQHVLIWLNELAYIYKTIGELDKAEEMHKKSLEIGEKLGLLKSTAASYGNLGLIYETRGQLDKAEEMHKKSLEIAEKLGLQEVMASEYGNLGITYRDRGQLDKAEEMHNKSLEINKKLGRLEGMAKQYGNLGVVYQDRHELDKAEEMLKKTLEIAEKLGLQEVIACVYGNLGITYRDRGQLDKAEEMLNKSLEIEKKLGRLEGIADDYGNLGVIYQMRGELDKAEEMFREGLKIDEKLGILEGIASQYGDLGAIYKERGDKKKAGEFWEKARDLYKRIGMPHMVKKVQGWIEGLEETRKSEDRSQKSEGESEE